VKPILAKFQIGKQGLTPGVLESLRSAFANRRQVRVSVLKSTNRDRQKVKDLADQIKSKLPFNVDTRIIGFTIILIKSNK
jgi:RNA-binding protein YhbY